MIAHAGLPEGGFESAGLHVGAKENRLVLPRHAAGEPGVFDLLNDGAGFGFVVGKRVQSDFFALAFLRPQLFAAAAGVVLYDGIGGLENGGGGAVVLFELDDFDGGVMFLHVEQVGDFRAAPAVDALIIVADHAEVPMFAREQMDELELGGVGILVFVHHHVTIFPGATGFERLGMLLLNSR